VPKHQEQKATVAGLVPAPLGGGDEFVDLGKSQGVFGLLSFCLEFWILGRAQTRVQPIPRFLA